jgi:hypothetical protein
MKGWYEQITRARSWGELLEVARSYLASLSPHEWNSVPDKCRPDRIKGIDDLQHWQECLANAYLEVAAADHASEIHRDMLAFFTAAAERASEMVGAASPPGEEATNDGPSATRFSRGSGS